MTRRLVILSLFSDSSLLDLTSGGSQGLSPPASSTTYGINWFDLDALCRAEGLANPNLRKELVNLHGRIYEAVASSLGEEISLGFFSVTFSE